MKRLTLDASLVLSGVLLDMGLTCVDGYMGVDGIGLGVRHSGDRGFELLLSRVVLDRCDKGGKEGTKEELRRMFLVSARDRYEGGWVTYYPGYVMSGLVGG